MTPNRCGWVNMKNPASIEYHDNEWCVETHCDRQLFEMLILEGFQAGLSWECILNKREAFRQAFHNFDPQEISRYDAAKCEQLMQNPGIIRNSRKIKAAVKNSQVFLAIQKEFGSFDRYIRGFTDGKTVYESCDAHTTSPLSDRISADLKKRGMSFVGTTIIYSYLQAIGVINAHMSCCDWYRQESKSE